MKRGFQIIGLVWLVTLAWFSFRPVYRFLFMPRATRAAWVEGLATNRTSWRNHREAKAVGDDPETKYEQYGKLEPLLKANDQKRRLLATLRSGQGKFGLRREMCWGVDTDVVFYWLLVEDGTLTYVRQNRDDLDPAWAFTVEKPRGIQLGFLRDDRFIEGEPSPEDSPQIVLRIDLPSRERPVYFY